MELIADMVDAESEDYGRDTVNSGVGAQRRIYHRVVAVAREEANHLAFSLSAIRQVVDTMGGLQGRKSIIYVSNGLPMTPGLGLMHEYASLFHDNSIMSNRGRFNRQHQYQGLGSAASSHEITIYTVDAEGLEVNIGGGAESAYGADATASQVGSSNYQGSMRYLAQRTGGIAVVNTNDVAAGLRRIRDDFFSYYSIGFPVQSSGGDRVHEIDVEVPGRKEIELRFRRRFVEKSLETQIRDQVLAGLVLDFEVDEMGLKIERGRASQTTAEYWKVPIGISLPLAGLTLLPQGDEMVGRVVLIVGARHEDGKQSDVQRQEHELLVPAQGDERPLRWNLEAQFLMTAGRHRVVVGLMDQITHRVSYSTLRFSVP